MAGIKFVDSKEIVMNGSFDTRKTRVATSLEPLNAIIVGKPQVIVENQDGKIVAVIDKDTMYISSSNYDKSDEILRVIDTINYTVSSIDAIKAIEDNIVKVQKLLEAISKISSLDILISKEDKEKFVKMLEDELNNLMASEEEEYEIIIT